MSVQNLGGVVGGMMPHHLLITASPNSTNTFFSQDVVAPDGVLITGCGAGGIPCSGSSHNCCGGTSSIPMVVLSRYFNHDMVTGSCVKTPVGLKVFDPGAPLAICPALRHYPRLILIVSGVSAIPASLIIFMIFL